MSRKIRVLVVDDSALMRKLIPETLRRDPSIEVVGTAMDGLIGLKRIEDLHPDVVTLDLEMPRMDGMEMLRQITRKQRIPVIIFGARSEQGADFALRALSVGAFDVVTKPDEAASGNLEQVAAELASRVKAAAKSGAPKLIPGEELPAESGAQSPARAAPCIACARNWRLDRRAGRPAVSVFAAPRDFPGLSHGGSAHARRVHGKIRAASQRLFVHRSERGAIGRSSSRGPRSDLPGKPSPEGPSHGPWRRGHGGRRRAGEWPQAIGGCLI